MPARMWLPPSGSGPGLVLFQEIFGVSPYIVRRAADLAASGYVVVAPELYWRLGRSAVPNGPEMLPEAMALASRVDWPAAVSDGAAAVTFLRGRAETGGRAGVVGFCFGGGVAFNVAATTPVDVLVSYYGSALPGLLDLAPQVTAPSLHHFGQADSYIDAETQQRIRAAVERDGVEFYTYPGADHAFDNDDFVLHHPEASTIAWGLTRKFLAKHYPVR